MRNISKMDGLFLTKEVPHIDPGNHEWLYFFTHRKMIRVSWVTSFRVKGEKTATTKAENL